MQELIYYVDSNDKPTGETSEKYAAHGKDTRLHAAFSVYVFNEKGQFLVTQRAQSKKVWPSVWTNSACGHPFPNESREAAIARRLQYELGMRVKDVRLMLSKYIYKTPPYNGIIEHEYCPVYIARAASVLAPNPDEVSDYYWMDWQDFVVAAQADGAGNKAVRPFMKSLPVGQARELGVWSWWCKDQLKQLKDHILINEYTTPTTI